MDTDRLLTVVTAEHVRQSNLIEGIDDPFADSSSAAAWSWLAPATRLNLEAVLGIHQIITADQLGDQAGKLRVVNVRVGSRVCPPWEQVSGLLAEWLGSMEDPLAVDPVERHVAFERIHPFIDGNGRTGRMLMWWHQLQRGEEPTLLCASERQDYYAWFRTQEEEDAYRLELWKMFDRYRIGPRGHRDETGGRSRAS